MSEREAQPDRDELGELLAAWCDGALTGEQAAELQRRLMADDAAADAFLRAADLHAELSLRCGGDVRLNPGRPGIRAAPAVVGVIRPARRYMLAAAALLLAAAAAVIYVFVLGPQSPIANRQPLAATLATITDLRGVTWSGDLYDTGDEVPAGDLHTAEGSVELMLTGGTMVQTDGPVELRLDGPTSVTLSRGAATFTCPHDGRGFTVTTPRGARIVDLGTRFSVWVGDDGATRVAVIEGAVEVAGAADAAPMRLTVGQIASVDAAGRSQARDPFTGDIPLGNLFDDPAGTPLDLAIASDTYQAVAEVGDLGVVRIVHGGEEPGTVQSIADDVRMDLRPLGWTNAGTPRPPVNDAWGDRSGEGGIRTTGQLVARNLPRTEDGIGMHPNLLLTFDLDALRRASGIAENATIRFVADRAGVGDTGAGRGAVHVAAVAFDENGLAAAQVNGRPVATEAIGGTIRFSGPIPSPIRHAAASFDLLIPPGARHLTLIAASAGSIESDHAVFSGARLVITPIDSPTPAAPVDADAADADRSRP